MKKTPKSLETIVLECPKTIEAFKKSLIEKNPEYKEFVKDEIIRLSITKTPYSILDWFDTLGHVGTLTYDPDMSVFQATYNGDTLMGDEDILESPDRVEALTYLVSYILTEHEKTL